MGMMVREVKMAIEPGAPANNFKRIGLETRPLLH
jgi:hypothetical protein